jgi:hypothetical protein
MSAPISLDELLLQEDAKRALRQWSNHLKPSGKPRRIFQPLQIPERAEDPAISDQRDFTSAVINSTGCWMFLTGAARLWDPYRRIAGDSFPGATGTVDAYHG